MNRSRGPLPPQTDHPDEWPELAAGDQYRQTGQYAAQHAPQTPPLSHSEQLSHGGGQQQLGAQTYQGGADAAMAGWQKPVMINAETAGQPQAHDPQLQVPQGAPQYGQYGQAANQQMGHDPGTYPNPNANPGYPAQSNPQGHGIPPDYSQQPQYTAPPAQHGYNAPPEYNAAPEYTAPPEYNAPAEYTAPPEYTAPADYTQPPQQRAVESPQIAAPLEEQGLQFGRYAPSPTLSTAPDVAPSQPGFGGAHQGEAVGADTTNFDLARYAPTQEGGAAQTGFPAAQTAPAHLPPEQLSYEQHGQQGQQGEWNDPNGFGGQAVQQDVGYDGMPVGQDGYEQDYAESDEDYDEPANGGRGLLIAASLVGAIAIGGGLAYGYKHFGNAGNSANSQTLKTIAANSRPVKVKPESPGGMVFRNKDRKVFSDRLRAGQGAGNTGVRKVPTLVITRDGNVAPPPARPAVRVAQGPTEPQTRLAVPGVFVPGLTITAPRVAPRQPIATAPISQPVQIAPARVATLPKARALPPQPPRAPEIPQAPRASKVIVAAPIRTNPQPSVVVSPPTAPAAGGISGYVAWISSSKDKVRTLASFASLQQKFPTLLAGKQPEIQKVVITKEGRSKGTWYRLRIGPPASKDATKALCNALVAKKGARECHVRRFK